MNNNNYQQHPQHNQQPPQHYQQHPQQQQFNQRLNINIGQDQQQQILIGPVNPQEGTTYNGATIFQPYPNQYFLQQTPCHLAMQSSYPIPSMYSHPIQPFNTQQQQQPSLPQPTSIISPPIDTKPIPPWQRKLPPGCFPMSSYLNDERCAETPAPIPIECQLGPETPSPSLPSTSPPPLDTADLLRSFLEDEDYTGKRRSSCEVRLTPKRHYHRRTKAQIAADRRAELEKTLKKCSVDIKLSTINKMDLPARVFVGISAQCEIRTKLPRVPRMKIVPSAFSKIVNIGFMKTQKGIAFACMSDCHFKTYDPVTFQQHLAKHSLKEELTSGSCGICNQPINFSSPLFELLHMVRTHIILETLPVNEILYSKVLSFIPELEESDNEENEPETLAETQETNVDATVQSETEQPSTLASTSAPASPLDSTSTSASISPSAPALEESEDDKINQEKVDSLTLNEDDLGFMSTMMGDIDDILAPASKDTAETDTIIESLLHDKPIEEDQLEIDFESDDIADSPLDTQVIEEKLERKDPDFDPQVEEETDEEPVRDEVATSDDGDATEPLMTTTDDSSMSEESNLIPTTPARSSPRTKRIIKSMREQRRKKRQRKQQKIISGEKRRWRIIQDSDSSVDSSDKEPLLKKSKSVESSAENSASCSDGSLKVSPADSSKPRSLNESVESKTSEISGMINDPCSTKEQSPAESPESDRTNDSGIGVQNFVPAQEESDFIKRISTSLVEKIKQKALNKGLPKTFKDLMAKRAEVLKTVEPVKEIVEKLPDKPVEKIVQKTIQQPVDLPADKVVEKAAMPLLDCSTIDPFEFMIGNQTENQIGNQIEDSVSEETAVAVKKKRGRPAKNRFPGTPTARKRPGGSQQSSPLKVVKEEPFDNHLYQIRPCSVHISKISKIMIRNATKGTKAFVQYEISSDEEEPGDIAMPDAPPKSPRNLSLSSISGESNTSKISGLTDMPDVPPEAEKLQDFDLSASGIFDKEIEVDDLADHSYCSPPKAVSDFPAVMDFESLTKETEEKNVEGDEDVFFDSLEVIPESPKTPGESEASSAMETAEVPPMPQISDSTKDASNKVDDEEMFIVTSRDSERDRNTRNLAELYPWIDDDIVEKWRKDIECAKVLLKDNCKFSIYKCMSIECSFFTSSFDRFKHHLKKHENKDRFFLCSFCLADEKRPEDLCKHVQEFHTYDRYQCNLCMYRSCEKFYCDVHRKKFHPKESVSILKSSGQILKVNDRKAVEDKLKESLDEIVKPLQCKFCSKTFYDTFEYCEHLGDETRKTNEREKQTQISLEIKEIQEKMGSEVNEFGLYRCVYCTDGFPEEALMREHLAVVHPQNFSFVCVKVVDIEKTAISRASFNSIVDLVDKKRDKDIKVSTWKGLDCDLTSNEEPIPEEKAPPLKILNAYSLSSL